VLATNKSCIEKTVVGSTPGEVQDHAIRLLTEGLAELKLLEGPVEKAIEEEKYKKFYMHRIGHWLGMDVHDVGSNRSGKGWRKYEAGMVVTVEPGIYVPEDDEEVPENFRGIGVRIEDDVHITENGPDVLTSGCPKEAADIEDLVGSKSVVGG